MCITVFFLNGHESVRITSVGSAEEAPNVFQIPIGTFLTEMLNANIEDIAARIANCEAEPPYAPCIATSRSKSCDFEKFSVELEALKKDYPHIFSLFGNDLEDIWNTAALAFCLKDPDGKLHIVNEIVTFKAFLDELIESPNLFSFEFLEYLNVIEAIPPFSVQPCSVHNDHHRKGISLSKSASLKELYSIFSGCNDPSNKEYRYDVLPFPFALVYIMVCSILEIARQGKVVRKCQYCGKYFIPAKRSDTLYCDNLSPENSDMTCKQYAASRLWYERQKEDELANLSRKIASAKGMLAKRNPDIPQYAESYEYFKAHRLTWIKAVKDGTKSKDEYREWLIYMQSKKRIKEATHGND